MGTDVNPVAWDQAYSTATEIINEGRTTSLPEAFLKYFEDTDVGAGNFRVHTLQDHAIYIIKDVEFRVDDNALNTQNLAKILYETYFKHQS